MFGKAIISALLIAISIMSFAVIGIAGGLSWGNTIWQINTTEQFRQHGFEIYYSTEHNFYFWYPGKWIVDDSNSAAISLYRSKDTLAAVIIEVDTLQQSLSQYLSQNLGYGGIVSYRQVATSKREMYEVETGEGLRHYYGLYTRQGNRLYKILAHVSTLESGIDTVRLHMTETQAQVLASFQLR